MRRSTVLRPQSNTHRDARELSGFWDFRAEMAGDDATSWAAGVPETQPIAVPGSWNEQIPELRDFCGRAWYQTAFVVPAGGDRKLGLRFGSVNYAADVWLNGVHVGSHAGGHLPFELDVTEAAEAGWNRLVVRVDNELAKDRVPPGSPPGQARGMDLSGSSGLGDLLAGMFSSRPSMSADFFPFGGIHRPVVLTSVHRRSIQSVRLLETDPRTGRLRVEVEAPDGVDVALRVADVEATAASVGGRAELELVIPDVVPWCPETPVLYDADLEVRDGGEVVDRYRLPVGMRTVEVVGTSLLLNGEPVVLKGFGRHEDYAIIGRGHFPAGNIRDYSMMRWMGANSFRTSHYPYSEEQLDLADRLGFLVIAETPAVGLEFGDPHEAARLETCLQMTEELIERDRNRACVVMWSVANEPMTFQAEAAVAFFTTVTDLARSLDDRPVTIVNPLGNNADLFPLCDVIGLNRYSGWYTDQGDIAGGTATLERELDALNEQFGKPIIVTEFGCDTLPGHHAEPPEMFSEEYQADFLESYIAMMDTKPFVVAQHVWNLADFKTGQGVLRAGALNHKGVLTRERRPKLAAHRLRSIWGG
jgi:beta-glucuronidase